MPNSDSGQPQTLHPRQQCLIEQSHNVTQAGLPPDVALHKVELLFVLYLLITLLIGMYLTYRKTVRRRRIQALEKLFRLNASLLEVDFEGKLSKAIAKSRVYEPIPLPISKPIVDTLSSVDIPLGQGGFARDYIVSLSAGDEVVIELKSERFDTFVSLLASDGSTVGENDDGPDGTTNSLLMVCIPKSDTYTVRVQASGEAKEAVGLFTLFVRLLRPKSSIQQY